MGFTHPGRAGKDQVGPIVQEAEVQQLVDLAFGNRRLVAIVKFFQMLGHRKSRLTEIQADAIGITLLPHHGMNTIGSNHPIIGFIQTIGKGNGCLPGILTDGNSFHTITNLHSHFCCRIRHQTFGPVLG